jgi:hypothetical protein
MLVEPYRYNLGIVGNRISFEIVPIFFLLINYIVEVVFFFLEFELKVDFRLKIPRLNHLFLCIDFRLEFTIFQLLIYFFQSLEVFLVCIDIMEHVKLFSSITFLTDVEK